MEPELDELEDLPPLLEEEEACPPDDELLEDACPPELLEDACPPELLEDACPPELLEDVCSPEDEPPLELEDPLIIVRGLQKFPSGPLAN